MQQNVFKGVVLVALGATSYGMLATFVKLAYKENYTTAEVTASQFALGILGMLIILGFQRVSGPATNVKPSLKDKRKLMIAGIPLSLTSVFYYLAVKFDIPVSIAIVFLMQTVWMGVVLEMILDRKLPSLQKVFAVIIVLIGTVLATNLLNTSLVLNWKGVLCGMLAAASFTTTMYNASRVAPHLPTAIRSLYMLLGGAIIISIFVFITQDSPFDFTIFLKWGLIVSLFGTVIPPLLLNAGFPHTGIGLGSIVSSLELPVSVCMAYYILNETVVLPQWIGIVLILMAIVLMNIQFKKKD